MCAVLEAAGGEAIVNPVFCGFATAGWWPVVLLCGT